MQGIQLKIFFRFVVIRCNHTRKNEFFKLYNQTYKGIIYFALYWPLKYYVNVT